MSDERYLKMRLMVPYEHIKRCVADGTIGKLIDGNLAMVRDSVEGAIEEGIMTTRPEGCEIVMMVYIPEVR